MVDNVPDSDRPNVFRSDIKRIQSDISQLQYHLQTAHFTNDLDQARYAMKKGLEYLDKAKEVLEYMLEHGTEYRGLR